MPVPFPVLRRAMYVVAVTILLSAAFPALVPAGELPVIDLTIQAGRFTPHTVIVPAGKKFKLRVTNKGPAVEEFESTDLNREQIVVPGHHIIVFLGPLAPGRYKFFGDFHPNTARGVIVAR